MKNLIRNLFWVVVVTHLLCIILQKNEWVFWSKMLLMPTLFWYFYDAVLEKWTTLQRWIASGLVFAFAGDTFLLFQKDVQHGSTFFLLGLISFLICHIFYIIGFLKYKNSENGFLTKKPYFLLPFLVYVFVMLNYLLPNVPSGLKIAVIVYSLVIASMALSALHLRSRTREGGAWAMLFGGALLFIVSDSLLSLGVFGGLKVDWLGFGIMLTYILGQYFIVRGAILVERS
jgi:uncharacterized membrane protein YhhN